jgi:transposase
LIAQERSRPDVQAARDDWSATVEAFAADRLIFLDETWFTTHMTRLYGYALCGQRLTATVPHGHWKTTTFVGGLTTNGFIAPMVLDGPMTGAAFTAYIEQVLAPEVRPGDLLILDNLSSHKTAAVQAALKACHLNYLYLPPYSPDLNPIENAFSKFKRLVRTAAERTLDGLWDTLGKLLDQFRPAECVNYLRHCGYPATIT